MYSRCQLAAWPSLRLLCVFGEALVSRRHARCCCAAPEVSLDHARITLDLGRCAFGDLFTVIEHGNIFRDTHDHTHMMLDQQDGNSQLIAQAMDKRCEIFSFTWVHAG